MMIDEAISELHAAHFLGTRAQVNRARLASETIRAERGKDGLFSNWDGSRRNRDHRYSGDPCRHGLTQ